MGSLTSGPKAPKPQSQIVYVQQPATPASPSTPATPVIDAEQSSAQIRKQNLLGRERSRFGTIQTSFRGLLARATADANQARKTLLGE